MLTIVSMILYVVSHTRPVPLAVGREVLQGGPNGRGKPPVDLDLGCYTILPGEGVGSYISGPLAAELQRLRVI